jgi:predicted Fe-S protein YdhL (DUF1289 family)
MRVTSVPRVPALSDKKRSPCVGVCRVVGGPYSRHCGGCWRTLAEIEGWSRYSDEEKADILRLLPVRASQA